MSIALGFLVVAVFVLLFFVVQAFKIAGFVALVMMAGAIYMMSILVGVVTGAIWFAGIGIFGQDAVYNVTAFSLAFYAVTFIICCKKVWFSIKEKFNELTA